LSSDNRLSWRGIEPEDACPTCGGSGYRTYGNTSTWAGGMGGCAMTPDVCDACWGSGDISRPWMDLRRLKHNTIERIRIDAQTLLAKSAGAQYGVCKAAFRELVGELERLSNGRKKRPYFFYELCCSLANQLRQADDE